MKKALLLLTTILFSINSFSQAPIWSKSSVERIEYKEKVARKAMPTVFQVYSLDMTALKSQLLQAPSQDNFVGTSNVIVQFPSADGTLGNYRIYESAVMHPDLAVKYQDIKTYIGQGIEDPTASITISTTIFGLHTMTLSGKTGTTFIDPFTKDLKEYIIYNKSNLQDTNSFTCEVKDTEELISKTPTFLGRATDGKFRTYRLAMACTIEYAAFHITAAGVGGGSLAVRKAAVLAAMVVTVNRVNTVYEREMSLKMQLVANNDLIIFVTTDNFSNTVPNSLINESQSVIDTNIGSANYDIGHTVSTGGGGLAGRGVVCIANQKANGITGTSAPVGDPYDIDFVAHEMGHQFGGNHTFAGDQGNCNGNRSNTTAVEPGSGTTIMAYAGLCSPQNVQSNSDAYFHAVSLTEMFAHITGPGNCVAGTNNGNSTPVIPTLTNYTIPNGTPFKLTSPVATDVNGDALTYCWEQNNGVYVSSPIPSATSTTGSNFRSYAPTTSLTRYFPKFQDVLNGYLTSPWELLPTVARSMDFRLTVRDNRTPNGGQTASANMTLTYASGAPFAVTSQNTAGITWNQGTSQTITWTVGGTSVPATTSVNILLSTDGGLTYPTVLAVATNNDGTQVITVPNIAFPYCRIKIEPTNNIYYAINSKTFAIGYTVTSTCNTYTDNVAIQIVDQAPGSYTTRTMNVPITGTISDINVTNKITHTYLSDVQTDISSPQTPTTFVKLFDMGCGNTNGVLNLKFSDAAAAINCAGGSVLQTVSPSGALSTFNGQNPQGNWTFRVYDNFQGDTGTINNWAIEVCTSTATLSTHDVGFDNFTIYPNPNSGNFNIQFSTISSNGVKVLVHDMRGRQIFENDFLSSATFNQNIHLNNPQAGVYLLTVTDGERKEVKKIVVE